MTDRLVRPDWVRRINLMAGSVGGYARDLVPLDAGDLLDTAVAAFGGRPDGDLGDPRWQERFEALVAAVDAAGMHVVGRLMTKQELLRSLRTRLLLTAAIDAAPEITRRPVTAPVIITGPARSGTSILFELLALDPDLRAPTAAEALHPVTLPEARAGAAGAAALPESRAVGAAALPESRAVGAAALPESRAVGAAALPESRAVGAAALPESRAVGAAALPESRAVGAAALPESRAVGAAALPESRAVGAAALPSCRRGCCPARVSCRRGCCPARVSCRRGAALPESRAVGAAALPESRAVGAAALPESRAVGAAALPEPLVLSECEQEFWADVQPEFQALHELRSDLPVECVTVTQGSFCGFHWSMIVPMEGWLPDPAVNYAYERQFLQVLQHGAGPTQWVLKTPAHLMLLPLLFAEFEDAWVVQTHRDPAKTMPSTVSTTAMIQWLRTDDVDVDRAAQHVQAVFAAGLNGSVDLRTSGAVPAERFVDVHFTELMGDPVSTMSAAYARMGRDFTDNHAAAVLDYLAHKPKGKFGVHRYQPEDWGFTAESLREAMAPYIDHFGVTSEG